MHILTLSPYTPSIGRVETKLGFDDSTKQKPLLGTTVIKIEFCIVVASALRFGSILLLANPWGHIESKESEVESTL